MAGGEGAPPAPPGGRDTGRWRRWTRRDDTGGILDLTDVDEVTTTLLAPPPEFQGLRRRVVDQFTILSANRCRLARSVNWGPLDGLLTRIAPASSRLDTRGRLPQEVSLLLPVSTLPKRALVAFDLLGPGGTDAHLMPYGVSVAIQGNLVALLAAGVSQPLPEPARRMVDAISRFRPGRLSSNRPELLAEVARHGDYDVHCRCPCRDRPQSRTPDRCRRGVALATVGRRGFCAVPSGVAARLVLRPDWCRDTVDSAYGGGRPVGGRGVDN